MRTSDIYSYIIWVNNQTSIIGNNSVNITTNNNTDIKGAVIANGSYDEDGNFIDSNNLQLSTKELDYKDINDFHREESKGFQFSTGLGMSTDAGENALSPKGSTTIGMTNTGQEREQITHATIGNGNITIANTEYDNNNQPLTPTPLPQGARDILAGLNRDVNNSQEITKDLITGALDGSMTIDNRVLWQLPNNILGAANTAANILAGYLTGKPVKIQIGEKGIEIIGGRLGGGGFTPGYGSAVTLGYFEVYYGDEMPNDVRRLYRSQDKIVVGYHEDGHIDQQKKYGPLFLPLYLGSGGWWKNYVGKCGKKFCTDNEASFFERDANQKARDTMKKRNIYHKYN